MASPIICLVFSLFAITETTNIFWTVPDMTVDDVTMSPDGFYYVLVGRTVNLSCRVTSSTYNSSSLVIALNESPRDDVIMPDDATAQVTVTNMAAGTFFWQCCVSSCPSMEDRNPFHPRISTVTLKYGDPPPPVSNLTCVFLDFRNLNCSLTINSTGQYVAWILTYCINDYIPTDDPLACPGNLTSRTKCDPSPYWPLPGQGVMLFHCTDILELQMYRIHADGVSNFGRTSYVTEIYTDLSIVHYSAVRRFRVHPHVTSTNVTLLWDIPAYILGTSTPIFSLVITHGDIVIYNKVVTDGDKGYHKDAKRNVCSYNVTNLRPATTYHAGLRARTRWSNYWSKPTYVNMTTLEAAPGVPPGLKPGMYTRWEDGVHLMVFWQAVPPAERNGKITRYQVCLDLPNSVSRSCNSSIPGDQFHCLLQPPEGSGNCTVTVQAGTQVGLSQTSSLRIPNIGQAPQRPLYVIVEQLGESSYNVSWVLANHNVRLDHVYVTWCQALRTNQEVTCINDVHTVEIDRGSATSYTVTLDLDPGLGKGAWFGVSTSVDDVSDGTTWNQCIFVKDGDMGSPPAMNVLTNASTVWLPLGFSYCDVSLNKGRPDVYEVSYQTTNTTSCSGVNCTDGSVIQEPAQFDTTEVILTELTRPAMYCVCLRVRSALTVGPYSYPPKLVDLSVLPDDPKPVDIADIVGAISGLVVAIVAVLCIVYHRRRLNPLKKIPIDLGMFRDMEHGDAGSNGENRISSENPAFLDVPDEPTPVAISTAHEDDVATMGSKSHVDKCHLGLRVLQTEQPRRPVDTDSGNASDAAMAAVAVGSAGGVEDPEHAPGDTQDTPTSGSQSYPSSGYNSTLNRSKTSRSSTGGSVKLTQIPDHLSAHQELGSHDKPDGTAPSLLPNNKQNRTASRVETQNETTAEVGLGGYVVYPGQVASVRNLEHDDSRGKDEERKVHLDYICAGEVQGSSDNLEYVRCIASMNVPNIPTDNLENVRCNVSSDVPNASTDNLETIRCNVSTNVPKSSTDGLECVRCNVSTDIPNASRDNLENVRCNVSTDVPNTPTNNFEYARCNVSADIPNTSPDDLEYVRCNVSTDIPCTPTDNLENARCNVSTDAPNTPTNSFEYVRCNVSTDVPNTSPDDLVYVRCNVSTDVPCTPTDNLENVRCNVSTDIPNTSTDDLVYVRCNVGADIPKILTDN